MATTFDVDQDLTSDRESTDPRAGILEQVRWNHFTRILFRFCFVYFILYSVGQPHVSAVFLGLLGAELPTSVVLFQLHLMEPIAAWVASGVLHVEAPFPDPVLTVDNAYMWVLLFCWAVAAALITVVWSILDRNRPNYVTLHKWFHIFVRLVLGGLLLAFGFAKVIPVQMQLPLTKLVQPFGSFSPLGVLWSQIGSNPVYEILLGCAEVVAGLLLIVPRTATMGALLALVCTAQVFVVNMTFDVPAKTLAFHMLLLGLVVLAPRARRLATCLATNRAVEPASEPQLFFTRRARGIALAVQIAFGLWVAGSQVQLDLKLWEQIGGSTPPLYGIWDVRQYVQDGVDRPPLIGDPERWRRFIVDNPHSYHPAQLSSQSMDEKIEHYSGAVDVGQRTISLAKQSDSGWIAQFNFTQPTPDQLLLVGEANNHQVRMLLQRVDLDEFPAISRRFQWVQDAEYMR